MADTFTSCGFIIFNTEGRILLLKGNTGWELPVVQESSVNGAVESLCRKLHLKELTLQEQKRSFGPIHFQFAKLDTSERTLSLPHTGFWRFGRFASFEEAWHIGRATQENILGWAEKSVAERLAKAA